MHGILLLELKKYFDAALGADLWLRLGSELAQEPPVYTPNQQYPDQDAIALIMAAGNHTGRSVATLLEGFGEFVAPELATMYADVVQPGWTTLDWIEHTVPLLHRVARDHGAAPPTLVWERTGRNTLTLRYRSHRRMCRMARGIIHGLARRNHERIRVTESDCMLTGQPECRFTLELLPPDPAG